MEITLSSKNHIIHKTTVAKPEFEINPISRGFLFPLYYNEYDIDYITNHAVGNFFYVSTTVRSPASKPLRIPCDNINRDSFCCYGGHFAGVHLFLAESDGKRVFVHLDTNRRKATVQINKEGYDVACFTTEGKIRAWSRFDKDRFAVFSNDGQILERITTLPEWLSVEMLDDFFPCWDFYPDYIYLHSRRSGHRETTIYDPEYECIVGTIRATGSFDNVFACVKGDMTSIMWLSENSKERSDVPPLRIERLDKGHLAYGMVVGLCDDYLRITANETPTGSEENARRFFEIAKKLPLEMQMTLCNKLGAHHDKDMITGKEFSNLRGQWLNVSRTGNK